MQQSKSSQEIKGLLRWNIKAQNYSTENGRRPYTSSPRFSTARKSRQRYGPASSPGNLGGITHGSSLERRKNACDPETPREEHPARRWPQASRLARDVFTMFVPFRATPLGRACFSTHCHSITDRGRGSDRQT